MTDDWSPPPSAAALLDDEFYQAHLRKIAAELAVNEPPRRSPPAPAPRSKAVTHKQLGKLLEKIGRAIKQELDRRMAELEAKQLKLGGIWKDGQRYKENTLVTHAGGLWLALADTDTRPGSGSPAWRLAVKKGSAA